MLLVRLLVGLLEQVELELGADHRREAERLRPLDLRAKHLARRGSDRRAVVPADVAEDERGRLEPGNAPQRRQVGRHAEVAVAPLPARERVAGDGIHLHLQREQVVAALDRVARVDLVDEELALQALAHQPSLHVGEGDDDGVDRARLHVRPQLVEAEHEGDPTASCRPTR